MTERKRKPVAKPAAAAPEPASAVIERVTPEIDGGLFDAKACAGETVRVEADIFREGHGRLGAVLLWRACDEAAWIEAPMRHVDNDRWAGSFVPDRNAPYEYAVEAWADPIASWIEDLAKKAKALKEVPRADVAELLRLFRDGNEKALAAHAAKIQPMLERIAATRGLAAQLLPLLEDPEFLRYAALVSPRVRPARSRTYGLVVDRERAVFGAWYELFPRSQAPDGRHGTFRDVIARLPDIRRMGFDVLYLPPIHPIGRVNRKGPNNSLAADDAAPGSPWAIGSAEGGHTAVHPQLGTLDDFDALVREAERHGMEIALDYAIQCAPDHPWVAEHPDWFFRLPDGTIRHAENPPKKYEDIYPVNFFPPDRERLWNELKGIVDFWISHGVRIFRVDNPHTKPLGFWKWLIESVRRERPDVIFLSEAFTRPKVLKHLAKAGFTQSYTYFTWRNSKHELREYVEELRADHRFLRPNFFANTPDILHEYLQRGGRNAFKIRLALAATLSPSYGIYSGYELCENEPREPGSEEYRDSDKYQIRPRDWNAPGNIKPFITRLNRIRADNRALRAFDNVRFCHSHSDHILCYAKWTADLSNIVVCVVNLDPHAAREDTVTLPIHEWGIKDWQTYQMKDLLTEDKYYWRGPSGYVRIDPWKEPVHIFRIKT